MKKIRNSILVLLLAVTIASSLFINQGPVVTKAADATSQSLQEQIDALDAQKQELEQQIADLSSQKAAGLDAKANLDSLAAVTQQKIAAAETLSAQLAEQIETTTATIAEKEKSIETTFNKFLDRLVVSYEEGNASYLSIIVNSSDMADFLTKMDMVSSMLEYDRSLKIQYQNEKAELEAAKKRLEEDSALQDDVLASLEADKAEYEVLSQQQADYIKSLEADISKANSALEAATAQDNALNEQLEAYLYQLAEQQRQLEAQRAAEEAERQRQAAAAAAAAAAANGDDAARQAAEAAAAAAAVDSSNVYVGGGFTWPLPGYYSISSGFGWRTLGGYSDYHRGIDIPAPNGTPIHAAKGGKVVIATGHGSYGNYVVIDHQNGESTLYAHQSMIGCSVGQWVNQGDIIGYVGSTGYSTGNHLHFEVRINGEAYNPLNYVSP